MIVHRSPRRYARSSLRIWDRRRRIGKKVKPYARLIPICIGAHFRLRGRSSSTCGRAMTSARMPFMCSRSNSIGLRWAAEEEKTRPSGARKGKRDYMVSQRRADLHAKTAGGDDDV